MFKIESADELRECFRPLDRGEVELSPSLRFPLIVRDYLAWTEPSGHRVYLVFSEETRRPPLGIVFRRDQDSTGAPPSMCEFCHSVRSGNGVSLLTAAASDRRRVGIPLCRNLECHEKVEGLPGADDLPGTPRGRELARRILARMGGFVRQNLF
jgi:hypothetical protein